jgi:leucyl/phenylalanyl-tRNA--protein transferase
VLLDPGYSVLEVPYIPAMSTPRFFPSPATARADGFLGIGGRLTTPWLLDAYRHGIFPWPLEDGTLAWFSPDPRAIIEPPELHVSRRLGDTLRSGRFTTTLDQAFAQVIDGCATAGDRRGSTWITPEMRRAYVRLHDLGIAHSVEVWRDGQLAGGTYGVGMGGVFCAESMFHRVRDASKVALVRLRDHLLARGYVLWDIQQWTPHTGSLGAKEILRAEYLKRVAAAVDLPVTFSDAGE